MIRVLICDDSALMRRTLKKIISDDPALEVAGTARDGDDAVLKARDLMPDVVTMDINMPGMDGITAMQYIIDEDIAPVLMVSSLTQEGAETTFEALALGAFDFVGKPGGTVSMDMSSVSRDIVDKLKAACGKGTQSRLKQKRKPTRTRTSTQRVVSTKKSKPRETTRRTRTAHGFKAVAIGISTGGPKTIFDVLPYLPADLNAAIFLTQHMPPTFTKTFAQRIDKNCALSCVEAEAGTTVEPGTIYLARGGMHLCLRKNLKGNIVIRTPKKPETQFIPGVDVMMESVLNVFGKDTVGVEMTGMGNDGAAAMLQIKESGGITIAESEETAIVFGMPQVAIELGGVDIVVPSYEIADEIIKAVA